MCNTHTQWRKITAWKTLFHHEIITNKMTSHFIWVIPNLAVTMFAPDEISVKIKKSEYAVNMMALNTNPLNKRGRNSSIIQLLETLLEVAEFFLQVNSLALFFHHRHTHTMAHCWGTINADTSLLLSRHSIGRRKARIATIEDRNRSFRTRRMEIKIRPVPELLKTPLPEVKVIYSYWMLSRTRETQKLHL